MNKTFASAALIGVLSIHSSFATPSDAEKYSRLNGGLQLMRTMQDEQKYMGSVGGIGIGAGLIIAPQIDTGVSQTWTWVGAGLVAVSIAGFFIPSFIDKIQKEVDQASGQNAKLEVLERTLRNGAELSGSMRKVSGWTLVILSPLVIGLSATQGARSTGLTAVGMAAGASSFLIGLASLLRPSALENLWSDYLGWAGGSTKTGGLTIEPTLSFGTSSLPGLGAGLSARF